MSMGMMTLVAAAIYHEEFKQNIYSFLKNKPYLFMSVYVLLMAITFFWSKDHHYFMQRMTIMLPLLVLPFAFHSFAKDEGDWIKWILYFFLFLIVVGNLYSLFNYWNHKHEYDIGYSFSKVIPTPFKSDHIRYSMAVVGAIAFGLFLMERTSSVVQKVILISMILFHILFLHILSAKTGLLSFYVLALMYIVYLFIKPQTRYWAILIMGLLVLVPIISYQFSASFRNKLSYMEYSFWEMQNNSRQVNVSDEGRLVSYQYALESIRLAPWFGVGIGDVYHEMDWRFKRDFPNRTDEPLLPHNQFMMVFMAGGVFLFVYFIVFQLAWLLRVKRQLFLHISLFAILFLGMSIDSLFETQYGACIYVFLLLFSDSHLRNSFRMNRTNN